MTNRGKRHCSCFLTGVLDGTNNFGNRLFTTFTGRILIMKIDTFNTSRWIRVSLFNLLLVAVLGVIMRYKTGFEFRIFDQKFLQHGHSHFAFAGWVSQTIMVLMVGMLHRDLVPGILKKYNILLGLNLFTSFGMLFSFIVQGYGPFSIFFSTASIVTAFYFAFHYYQDLKVSTRVVQKNWFNAALVFNLLSTLGTGALVFMIVSKNLREYPYLSSVYWYLHFQYNGWFFMACMGLFAHYYHVKLSTNKYISPLVFHLFCWSVVPAYGLSVLWLNLPLVLYAVVILGTAAQLLAWVILLQDLSKMQFLKNSGADAISRVLFYFLAIALSIKLLLQAASVIPDLNTLVFGFRNIVIAYLHLILLAIITVALLTFSYSSGVIPNNAITITGIKIFIAGIFLNELALAVQGIASFKYIAIPGINTTLFVISLVMLSGVLLLFLGQNKRKVMA